MHRFLETHNDIFFPKKTQELHYFDIEKNFKKGVKWFEGFFQDVGDERIIAQTSPMYIYEPCVPKRMQALTPDAKLIAILRDPVDRAYSHYWHERRFGYESLPFEDALQYEAQRIAKDDVNRRHYSYTDRGYYAKQLSRFMEYFPKDHMLLIESGEFYKDIHKVGGQLAKFLDIDEKGFDYKKVEGVKYNASRIPRSHSIQSLRKYAQAVSDKLAYLIDIVNLRTEKYPPIDPRTKSVLRGKFEDDLLQLQELTDFDVKRWL